MYNFVVITFCLIYAFDEIRIFGNKIFIVWKVYYILQFSIYYLQMCNTSNKNIFNLQLSNY